MIAAVYHGPEDLRVEEYPTPHAGAGEIVLRVTHASICATDLRIVKGLHRKYAPGTVRIPGHELVGTVFELGPGVGPDLRLGQRVFVAPNIGCGNCPQCRQGQNNLCPSYDALGITLDGAFAEFVRVPAAFLEQGNVVPVEDSLESEAVALAEPLACVLRGQRQLGICDKDVVLILGAGPIGVMHVLAARAAGAKKILVSEQAPERLRMALEAGADRVVNFREEPLAEAVALETEGRGADAIVVAAGVREAIEAAPALASTRGRINLFAGLASGDSEIRLDAHLIHYKELIVTGTTGCSTADCRRSMELIRSGKIELGRLIGGRYPLDRALDAVAAARTGDVLKVVLHPSAGKEET